jgi:2-dehydropantoate 2-reductase
MRIAVVGSGGVGGYLGGRLANAGVDVSFIARGAHLAALRTQGLRLHSPRGDLHLPNVNATDDANRVGPVDFVLFAVKLYDTEKALAHLPPLLGPATVVLPVQNGVEIIDVLQRAVGRKHTAGGTVYITAVVAEPGLIRHTALDHLVFGELDGTRSPRLERLVEACRPAGFKTTLSDNVVVEIWTKFVALTVFSGMTAVTRCPIGTVVADPDLWSMALHACREASAIARAKGVRVPDEILDGGDKALKGLQPQSRSSMLEDLERGRPLELAWLNGAVVRLGRELGVDTPVHRFIFTALKPHARGAAVR